MFKLFENWLENMSSITNIGGTVKVHPDSIWKVSDDIEGPSGPNGPEKPGKSNKDGKDGKDGQNARLAARLTGWRIDIHSDGVVTPEESEV